MPRMMGNYEQDPPRIDCKGLKHVRPPYEALKSLKSGITYIQYLFKWKEKEES